MLTERQRQIKTRLENGMGAREVADELGISRNAVYQQIQRMRHHGDLPSGYTPSGQPTREGYGSINNHATSKGHNEVEDFDPQGFVEAFMAKEQRRKHLVSELEVIARRLTDIASELV
jgi:transposase-like protein